MKILLAFHNAVINSLGYPRGILTWSQPLELADRARPATSWPLASLAPDNGPDIRAGKHYVTRAKHMNLNWDYTPGFNHGIWNAAKGALKSSKLWGHICTLLLMYWCRHGPFRQATRLSECRDAAKSYFDWANPRTCPLFQWILPLILKDWNKLDWLSHEDVSEHVFELLKESKDYEYQGEVINMNRWMKLFTIARREMPHWHERLLGAFLYCFEMDLLSGAKFVQCMIHGQELRAGEEQRGDRMRDGTSEQRTLTRACKNLLVTSCMIMHCKERQRRMQGICAISEPSEHWLSESNKTCRTVLAMWVSWCVCGVRAEYAALAVFFSYYAKRFCTIDISLDDWFCIDIQGRASKI